MTNVLVCVLYIVRFVYSVLILCIIALTSADMHIYILPLYDCIVIVLLLYVKHTALPCV